MPITPTPVAIATCSEWAPDWSEPVSSMEEALAIAELFGARVVLYPCDEQGVQGEDLPSCGWADPSGDFRWL